MSRGLFNSVTLDMDLELRRPGLRVPFSCRFHRRVMTSVVVERPISLHVFVMCFDRLGRCFLTFSWLVPGRHDLYSWTVFIGFLSGLACRPTDSFIVRFVALFLERRQSWAGGLVSLGWWLGLFLVLVCGFEQLCQ